MYRKIHLRTNPYLIKDGKYYPETRDDIHFNFAKDEDAASAIMALVH